MSHQHCLRVSPRAVIILPFAGADARADAAPADALADAPADAL